MIISCKTVLQYLKMWVAGKMAEGGKEGFAALLSGGIDSAACACLCLEASHGKPVAFICPGFHKEIETDFVKWAAKQYAHVPVETHHPYPVPEGADAAFWIPSGMSFLSERNLLTCSAIIKNEYSMIKKYRYDGHDCHPLIDMYRSEIMQLADHMHIPGNMYKEMSRTENETGTSFSELEWMDRENASTNIIDSESPPTSSRFWGTYDQRKRAVTSTIYSISRRVKHKEIHDKKKCLIRANLPGIFG